jgi:MraZ protein
MFEGTHELALDQKGRITMPTRLRPRFVGESGVGQVVVTKSPDGCLLLFTPAAWSVHREALSKLPLSAKAFVRIFIGNAQEVEIDDSGRILLPPDLRKAAKLDKKVELVGMLGHMEIWDPAARAANEEQAIAAGLPEALGNLTL